MLHVYRSRGGLVSWEWTKPAGSPPAPPPDTTPHQWSVIGRNRRMIQWPGTTPSVAPPPPPPPTTAPVVWSVMSRTGLRSPRWIGGPAGVISLPHLSLEMVDATGTARANLSGLRWAFFEQTSVDGLAAPVDSGLGSTNGAGVLDILLPNTSLLAGDQGLLVISNGGPEDDAGTLAFASIVTVQ